MDTERVGEKMREVAAELITPRFKSLSDDEIHEKAPGDPVTVADREAEVALTDWLNDAYPDAVVLGEEAYAEDKTLMDRYAAADHAFTLDPVDGTKNFVKGSPDHAVMVAELRAGECVRSWILQPQYDTLYTAEKGAGAWRNGERISVAEVTSPPEQWRGVTSRRRWLGGWLEGLADLELTWVCCGVDYPHLALGDADFAVYAKTLPWDHEPGGLLLREAGGFVGASPLGGLIAAAGPSIYETVRTRVANTMA